MCQNKNNEIKVKMAKEVNNASIESPMIYNADLKLENRVEGNKYQTSKFINKPIRVHFQDNHCKILSYFYLVNLNTILIQ